MTPKRGWKPIDVLVMIAIVIIVGGLVVPMVNKVRRAANSSMNTNHMKSIGFAVHTHNDTFYCIPNNGGADDTESMKKTNYGWHNWQFHFSGTWATQIMVWLQARPCPRFDMPGAEPPEVPEIYPEEGRWQVAIPEYLCAERARRGFKTSRAAGCYPGPVTDFAINIFLNSYPQWFADDAPRKGFCRAGDESIRNGDWAAYQGKYSIQGITDGAANTILAGQKAVPRALYQSDEARDGDEGIFSPGNWSLKDGKKTLVSTGTGRGHVVVANSPTTDQKEYPKDHSVPWMFQDRELYGEGAKLPYQLAYGGPFKEGVHFLFADGSVRILSYDIKGTIVFAQMLYPNDSTGYEFE